MPTSAFRAVLAPRVVETMEARIDPVPVGRFTTVMRAHNHGDQAGSGRILVAGPGQRPIWTKLMTSGFRPAALGGGHLDFAFSVDLRLAPDPAGCGYAVTVRHTSVEDARKHAGMGFDTG